MGNSARKIKCGGIRTGTPLQGRTDGKQFIYSGRMAMVWDREKTKEYLPFRLLFTHSARLEV